MWYFAYGSDIHQDSVMDWARHIGQFVPPRGRPQPAVLLNHRLSFPAFDEFWQGGVADAEPQAGKAIGGALFNVTPSVLDRLDAIAQRTQDQRGEETGIRRRQILKVKPYDSTETVDAIVYRLRYAEQPHVPPTDLYLQRMADAAWRIGLSAMWVMHLQSFASQNLATKTRVGALSSAMRGDEDQVSQSRVGLRVDLEMTPALELPKPYRNVRDIGGSISKLKAAC